MNSCAKNPRKVPLNTLVTGMANRISELLKCTEGGPGSADVDRFRGLFQARRVAKIVDYVPSDIGLIKKNVSLNELAQQVKKLETQYVRLHRDVLPRFGEVLEAFFTNDLSDLILSLNMSRKGFPDNRLFSALIYVELFDIKLGSKSAIPVRDLIASEVKLWMHKLMTGSIDEQQNDASKAVVLTHLLWAWLLLAPDDRALPEESIAEVWALVRKYERTHVQKETPLSSREAQYAAHRLIDLHGITKVLQKQRDFLDSTLTATQDRRLRSQVDELLEYVQDVHRRKFDELWDLIEAAGSKKPPQGPPSNDPDVIEAAGPKELYAWSLHLAALLLYVKGLDRSCNRYASASAGVAELLAGGSLELEDRAYFPVGWTEFAARVRDTVAIVEKYKECTDAGVKVNTRPLLFAVVGPPGAGKSELQEAIKRALSIENDSVVSVDFGQAQSVTQVLNGAWQGLESVKGPKLLVCEEFDSKVGLSPEQYRYALTPFYSSEAARYDGIGSGAAELAPEEQGPRPHVSTRKLGGFVALCIFSTVHDAASVRRMLSQIEKGADFLSRIDAIIEVPPIQSARDQVYLAVPTICHELLGPARRQPNIQERGGNVPEEFIELERRAWIFMGWIEPTANRRTLSKLIKTAKKTGTVRFEDLNADDRSRSEFQLVEELVAIDENKSRDNTRDRVEEIRFARSTNTTGDVSIRITIVEAAQEQTAAQANHVVSHG